MPLSNRDEVILRVFQRHYTKGAAEVLFSLEDIREAIRESGYTEHNIPDLRYQYTSGRAPLPKAIDDLGPWMIQGRGKSKYAFVKLSRPLAVSLPDDLMIIPIPDATPQIVLE